jgi:hypothetical protein
MLACVLPLAKQLNLQKLTFIYLKIRQFGSNFSGLRALSDSVD